MSTPAPRPPPNDLNTGIAPFPPQGGTKLILEPSQGSPPSSVCETDSRTALKRGMKEYIEQLTIDHQSRELRFLRVFDVWAEREDLVNYPSAIVYAPGEGIYDASSFTPTLCELGNGEFLKKKSELTVDIQIHYWCTDTEERVGITKMLEDALTPGLNQYGITLEFPHYFNQHGQYELTSSSFPDTEVDAFRRNRPAIMTLSSQVPVVSLVSLPLARPKLQLTVEDGVDC